MSENFDDIEKELDEDSSKKSKSEQIDSAINSYRNTRDVLDKIRNSKSEKKGPNVGENDGATTRRITTGGTATGSTTTGSTATGSTAAGSTTTGSTAAGSTAAGSTAAGGAAAGGAAAGGAAAGGAATGGAAAGGAAAGAAAGGAAAGGAGVIAAIGPAILVVVIVIFMLLLFVGAISFFQTAPGMMMDKITEISSGLWTNFKSFFEGNSAYINEEDQTRLAEYIENMGYDVVGYGFASPGDVKVNETNNAETKSVQSKYLLAYLLSDYNTYAKHSTVQEVISTFWSTLWGGNRNPPTGMLKFDDDGWLDATSVEVDRDKKTLKLEVWNPELSGLNLLNKDTYVFSLDGWTGKYGKPLEFLLTLHLSTMAPDLAYHVATDKEFDTKVHIAFMDMEAYLKLQYVINAETIEKIKSDDFTGIRLWEIEGLEYLEAKISAEGTLILSAFDMEEIVDKMSELIGYNQDVVDAIDAIGLEPESIEDAVDFCKEHSGKGKQLLSKQPYITFVEKSWYKNIYFVINDEIRRKVKDDEWVKSAPDFNAYENHDAGEIEVPPYDFHPDEDSDQATIVSDTSKGVYQIIEKRQSVQITQNSQPLKGNTNPRIKELFVGSGNDNVEGENPKPEYYIYDGSYETAKAIDDLKVKENAYRSTGNHTEAEVSEYINSIDEKDLYREIDFNKNSLTALSILENMQSEDADYLIRDFKALLIELEYFKASDLADKSVNALDWIIPDYTPENWPDREYEKQNFEYGTYIRSKESLKKLREESKKEDNDAESDPNEFLNDEEESEDSNTSSSTSTESSSTSGSSQSLQETGDGFPSSTMFNGVKYRNYKQAQGSYAKKSFWSGTISSHGCGPTASAIIASGYGKLDVTPATMADKIVTATTLDKVNSALASIGITSKTKVVSSGETQAVVNDIRKCFSEGKPVLILMSETTNNSRPKRLYSGAGHFMVLLGEENGKLIMSNPGRSAASGNVDESGLEAFVRDYMTDYPIRSGRGYLVFDNAPDGSISSSQGSVGYEAGMKVITPGIGEVTKVSENSITIKFTETNLVKDMTMTIKGFKVNSSITVGATLDKEQEIGVTTDEDILLIMRAPNKAVIENIEDYMPPPGTSEGSSAYYGELSEDEFEMFAAVINAEGGTACGDAVAYVIKNRALDTVHFSKVNTIADVMTATTQYATVFKVPGSGPGNNGYMEKEPPAGARTYKLEGKGEYWVGYKSGKFVDATDETRNIARQVLDGTMPDRASAQLGKLCLYQVTASAYKNHDEHCVTIAEDLFSHNWGCITGKHETCQCTLP